MKLNKQDNQNMFLRYLIASISFIYTVLPLMADNKYLQFMNDADKAVEKGDYQRAIDLYSEAVATEPDNSGNVMLLSNIGMLHYYQNNYSLALMYLSLAHDMAPESITILSNRAKVFSEAGYSGSALQDYDRIIQLDSTKYKPFLGKGIIYMQMGDTLKASNAFEKMALLTDTSKSRECTAALAWLAAVREDGREGIKQYTILINEEPTADLYAARAICYVSIDDFTSASEDIAEAIKLNELCPEIFVARAYLNKRTYRNDDALKDAQRAIELGADKQRVRRIVIE